jgi:hypothetical protein
MRVRAALATSSTARSKTALLAFEGALNPLIFLTNWMEAARISSSVAGGWKLKSVLMFLHMTCRLGLERARCILEDIVAIAAVSS